MHASTDTAVRDPMNTQASSPLEIAHAHYASRNWMRAFAAFNEADDGSSLSADDVEAFAWSAALTGRTAQQVALFERLFHQRMAAGESAPAARAALWLGFRLFSLGEHGRAGGWLARAEAIVREKIPDSAEAGLLLLPEATRCLVTGDAAGALEAATRAARIGTDTGDRDVQAFARNLQGRALLVLGQVDAGLRALDEAMLAASSDELSPLVAGLVYCSSITACHSVFALDRCREWTDALASWCERQPELLIFTGACRVMRSEVMQMQGAWEAAEREAQAALGLASSRGAAADAAAAAYQVAELRRLRGDYELAEASYREAMRHGMDPQPGLSLLRLAQGNASAAATSIRRVCDSTADGNKRLRHLPAAVEIFVAAGRVDEASACADALRVAASTLGTEVLAAIADHAASSVLLATGDAASALVPAQRALESWRRHHAPYFAARLRVQVARACIALDDHASAQWELEAALQEFESLGAKPEATAVRQLLRSCEPAPHAGKASHPLTQREVQVLELVARGWSNKVIARELSLSDKTIDRHLSNIFDKLGVGSRTAAAAYAIERHLVGRATSDG
jgi:DNA-binding NarL/FixJ family response regulator